MVQGIWAKVPIPPSTHTLATLIAYTQPCAKIAATHRHCCRTACMTLQHISTMVAPTQMDSYTILFTTPIHTLTMALTTLLSHTLKLRMQTLSQTHSSKILTFSYRLALPREAPSHRRSTSALMLRRKPPSRTTMHNCPPSMST